MHNDSLGYYNKTKIDCELGINDTIILSEPKCLIHGVYLVKNKECNDSVYISIPALIHDTIILHKEPTYTELGCDSMICKRCGDLLDIVAIQPLIFKDAKKPTEGDGSKEKPYQISNINELIYFMGVVNGKLEGIAKDSTSCAIMMNDIDVSTICGRNVGNWIPIGSLENRYSGTLNGQGYNIINLYSQKYSDYLGFFGNCYYGEIMNLGLENDTIRGKYHVGGICGFPCKTPITNCHNTGYISGKDYCGGIAGESESPISLCYNTGQIYSDDKAGGITGQNNSSVTNCYNTGNIGGYEAGGITGQNEGKVNYCHSIGKYSGILGGEITGNSIGSHDSCYYIGEEALWSSWHGVTNKTEKQYKSGEVCYLLNAGQTEAVWHQTIGVDSIPTFNPQSKIVKYDSARKKYYNVTTNSIDDIKSHNVVIYVMNRTITISDEYNFRIFDTTGHDVTNQNGNLSYGIYLVSTKEFSKKVVVK
ncbi:MAG: hypothetical protein M0P12_07245 [Paludibacteraceae bacterium]|nr:hypothetical protein [Paludibacteraceae bacterium]